MVKAAGTNFHHAPVPKRSVLEDCSLIDIGGGVCPCKPPIDGIECKKQEDPNKSSNPSDYDYAAGLEKTVDKI